MRCSGGRTLVLRLFQPRNLILHRSRGQRHVALQGSRCGSGKAGFFGRQAMAGTVSHKRPGSQVKTSSKLSTVLLGKSKRGGAGPSKKCKAPQTKKALAQAASTTSSIGPTKKNKSTTAYGKWRESIMEPWSCLGATWRSSESWEAQEATQMQGSHLSFPRLNRCGFQKSYFVGCLFWCGCRTLTSRSSISSGRFLSLHLGVQL